MTVGNAREMCRMIGRTDLGRDLVRDHAAAANTSWSFPGSETGGWQVKPEQTTAKDFPDVKSGKLGIVAASAGGRLLATAWFAAKRITLLPKANEAAAAEYNAAALLPASSPAITTTCRCGWKK